MNLSVKRRKKESASSKRVCWDKEGRRVPNLGTSGTDGSLISLQASNFHWKQSKKLARPRCHGASPEYENNPARVVQVVKPKTLGRMSRAVCMI